jgi:hypothetical protein
MKKIYWIGPRESDIDEIKSLFAGSITIFGSNEGNNISYCLSNTDRINHNERNINCDNFFRAELEKLVLKDDTIRFLFYNPSLAYEYGRIVKAHSVCINDYNLLIQLNDKTRCRVILQDIVNTIPFVTLSGRDCTYSNIKNYFLSEEFIIQDAFSSGGDGTTLVGASDKLDFIEANKRYLVSPYIKDGLSINVHIVIGSDNILFFPPSVQIVNEIQRKILYFGADFICYTSVDNKMQSEIKDASITIGKKVQSEGYRGVLGIDFLIKDNVLYFTEINPRFQASTQLLNKGIRARSQSSIQELHIAAFDFNYLEEIDGLEIPFSNYNFTTSNVQSDRLIKIVNSPEIIDIQQDGYKIKNKLPSNRNIYLFRCIFNTNISSFFNGKLHLHPNIYTEDITPFIQSTSNDCKPYIKIALLNHGLSFTPKAYEYAKNQGTIRDAVFDAIDIKIFDTLYINVPFSCKFCSFSPFSIDFQNESLVLLYNANFISKAEISFMPEQLINRKTLSGVPYEDIINIANDRIRINPAPVCIFKKMNIACKFCNLPIQNSSYDIDDIKEVIDYCLENVSFRHFLIGGGTYSIQGGWHIIIEIASYIHSKCDKKIYLMSIPPPKTEILLNLYNVGITEVAFNLETFDQDYAIQLMPGKGKIAREIYFHTFKEAVKIWGKNGNVRSLLIYGFDPLNAFLEGIETLCKNGVEPIISVFRPLKDTPLEYFCPPPTTELFFLYQSCQNIVHKYSLILGPDCVECQNNTLSYTE